MVSPGRTTVSNALPGAVYIDSEEAVSAIRQWFLRGEDPFSRLKFLPASIEVANGEISSVFVDRKYNQLRPKLGVLSFVLFDTFQKTHRLHSKINGLWQHALTNASSISYLSEGRNIGKSAIIEKIAVFTSLNEAYVNYAIVCFESFRRNNPHLSLDFFVIANNLSEKAKVTLSRNSISLLEVDLNHQFKTEKNWPYPSECFWLFNGPVLLHDLGYTYSLYVDADVQCNSRLDLNWIKSLPLIAGANRGKTLKQFIEKIDNFSQIRQIFNIDLDHAARTASLNSGVLFFNNRNYVDSKIYEKAVDLFNKSKSTGFPRLGDDSLLCLLMATYSNYQYTSLSREWNDYHFYKDFRANSSRSLIIHHFRQKPWKQIDPKYSSHRLVRKFVSEWQSIYAKMINDGKL